MRTAEIECTGIRLKIGARVFKNLRHADDTMIIAGDPNFLKLLANKVKYESTRVGLELNLAKTKVMTTGKS